MYTKTPYPGKFEGNASQKVAEAVYDITLQGCWDTLGDVEGFGFFAFVVGKKYGFILAEDSQGFVEVTAHSLDEARIMWKRIEKEYASYCEEETES